MSVHYHQFWCLIFQALLQVIIGIPCRLHATPTGISRNSLLIPEDRGIDIHPHMAAPKQKYVDRILRQIIKIIHRLHAVFIFKF